VSAAQFARDVAGGEKEHVGIVEEYMYFQLTTEVFVADRR
jgi:hypothetical protein